MFKLVSIILSVLSSVFCVAQNTSVSFVLNPDTYFKQQVDITTFKFYISSVNLYKNGENVFQENNSYHLIDLSDTSEKSFNLPTEVGFDSITFNLGIDSITNVSGAFGGDLDPTNGMYWSWQSGYINFKIEGKYHAQDVTDEFTYHIGGYLPPFSCVQNVQLDVAPVNNAITIRIDGNELVSQLKKLKIKKVMRPSDQAVTIAKIFASCFYVK